MYSRLLAAAAICTAGPLLAVAPTVDAASASSASVVGEASCLYGGPSWMSSWSVSSEFPFSVYGSGLERTHQFDEMSATLEVLVNTGSSVDPVHELVAVTIDRPEGCDGTTPEPVVEVEPVAVRGPVAPTADASASSASVVGEASCLYGGPSWMSSWSVSSEFPFSVYGSGLERTHQFDEMSATLEVLVNTGSSVDPVHELVAVTIDRPEGCDGTTPEPVVEVEPAIEPKLVIESEPFLQAAMVVESTFSQARDDDDARPHESDSDAREDRRDDRRDEREDRRDGGATGVMNARTGGMIAVTHARTGEMTAATHVDAGETIGEGRHCTTVSTPATDGGGRRPQRTMIAISAP